MAKPGKIALIGSGELTPSMVEVHKFLLSGLESSKKAYFLDTPAGFQPNVGDIGQKAQGYFHQNVGHQLEIASYASKEGTSQYDFQLLVKQMETAGYVLVGPGSPTYMLRQMAGSAMVTALKDMVQSGGCLAIASAAALTAGTETLPVYEIYKVGEPLHWQKGLDILAEFDLDVVIVPHWDNNEGGSHDTRFCYMGENRFSELKGQLPETTIYMGIDEHTACILDFERDMAEVRGQGGVTLLQGNRQVTFAKGDEFSLRRIRGGLHAELAAIREKNNEQVPCPEKGEPPYWEIVHSIENRFHEGLRDNSYGLIATALLDFDTHLVRSVSNHESEENISQAREKYRELIVLLSIELQTIKEGFDLHFYSLLENLLHLRSQYKRESRWQEADAIRDVLRQSKIEIEDTAEGAKWRFSTE